MIWEPGRPTPRFDTSLITGVDQLGFRARFEGTQSLFELSLSLPCSTDALPVTESGGRCVGVHRGAHAGYGVTEPGETAQPVGRSRRHGLVQPVLKCIHPRPRCQPDVPPGDGILRAERRRQQFVSQPGRLRDDAGKLRVPRPSRSSTSNRQHDDRPDGESDE